MALGVIVFDYGDPPNARGARCVYLLSSQRHSAHARRWLASCAAALLLITLGAGTATAAPTPSSASAGDPTVISDWNAIAVSTLAGDTTKQPVEDILYMAFVQAAVYNAVVGVEGRYAPYRFHAHAPRGTSVQAAAVAAAHKVLVTYVPSAQGRPGRRLRRVAGADSRRQGEDPRHRVRHPRRRQPDPAARPRRPQRPHPVHPAAGTGCLAAHPAGVRADVGAVARLRDAAAGAQRHPVRAAQPPPALTSARYTRDFNEVKALGSATSTVRTAAQTSTALFFSGNALVQFNAALRDQVSVRHLDIVDAARMFAAIDMSVADAEISVWHAKYVYGFWRPITAINLADTDGNPATVADPSWVPLLPTPDYPEYPSGYNAFISTVTHGLENLFQTRHLQLTLTSTAVPGVQRHYDSGSALRQDVVDARVWLGIHFRSADTAARDLGRQLAAWTLDHYFQPVDEEG